MKQQQDEEMVQQRRKETKIQRTINTNQSNFTIPPSSAISLVVWVIALLAVVYLLFVAYVVCECFCNE